VDVVDPEPREDPTREDIIISLMKESCPTLVSSTEQPEQSLEDVFKVDSFSMLGRFKIYNKMMRKAGT